MIGFVGLSDLGIVSSIAAAAKGFEVVAYGPDAAACAALQQCRIPLFEPNLTALLAPARERIRFTANVAELARCELIFFSQEVPTDSANRCNLEEFTPRLEEIASSMAQGATLVILSQVPPGFTRKVWDRLRQYRRDLTLYCQVETLIFGRAVERAMQPERFIVGCAEAAIPLADGYARFLGAFECPILPMRYESAELAKISISMWLAASASTANSLAEMCEALGADWSEIVPALKLDQRIGPHAYLTAGLGIGGGNLEDDLIRVRSLAQEHGTDAGIVDAWLANSRSRREWALRTLHAEVMSHIDTPNIALWGLACKPDTSSTKHSSALAFLDVLRSFAVRAYDPHVRLDAESYANVRQTETAVAACVGADVLVVMTPWDEFGGIEPRRLAEAMRGRVLIDPFGALDYRKCGELGFSHFQLGVPARRRSA